MTTGRRGFLDIGTETRKPARVQPHGLENRPLLRPILVTSRNGRHFAMENPENVEKHQHHVRVRSTDDVQDQEIADIRSDIKDIRNEVNEIRDKLQTHNERHYLLMGIIATVSFLAGMGIKILELFKA